MRLNWISPLPPLDHLAAAVFTGRVLPAFAHRAELTLWTLQPSWEPWLEQQAPVRRLEGSIWPVFNEADLAVYHLADEPSAHGQIWDLSREHPGLVVLHDRSYLRMLATVLADGLGDPEGFVAAMTAEHGEDGRRAAREILDHGLRGDRISDSACERFPLVDLARAGALGSVGLLDVNTARDRQATPGFAGPDVAVPVGLEPEALIDVLIEAALASRDAGPEVILRRASRRLEADLAGWVNEAWGEQVHRWLEGAARSMLPSADASPAVASTGDGTESSGRPPE